VEDAPALTLPDIHNEVVTSLQHAGYTSASQILEAGADALKAIEGFDQETVDAVLAAAAQVQGA